ncbi:Scramblase-domain-containing protein [Glomus cerebriforme]|uniref:Phospholipid scramblase n=1 Tax=Glomus cerebriforme TaxID=658196 RepID=A0A397S8I5_9GLOM|nr:Scramblase-domain-containing protein [Glomus cerebriforme]
MWQYRSKSFVKPLNSFNNVNQLLVNKFSVTIYTNKKVLFRSFTSLRRQNSKGIGVSRINRINVNDFIERFSKKTEQNDSKIRPHVIQQSFEILNRYDLSVPILKNSALVVTRQLEMLNVFLGFEQANKYAILDPNGNCVGYIAEEESFTSTILRQLFRTHRKFNAMIMDLEGQLILKIRRPFAWINSRIFISTNNEQLIGEVHQQWHLWRRRYNLFINQKQFARIDAGFLSWDFNIENEHGDVLGSVNRNFSGFAREIFTDTGQYVIRMESAQNSFRNLSLDERAVILAAAVSIDFDYFSRLSEHGGFLHLPIPFISDD